MGKTYYLKHIECGQWAFRMTTRPIEGQSISSENIISRWGPLVPGSVVYCDHCGLAVTAKNLHWKYLLEINI